MTHRLIVNRARLGWKLPPVPADLVPHSYAAAPHEGRISTAAAGNDPGAVSFGVSVTPFRENRHRDMRSTREIVPFDGVKVFLCRDDDRSRWLIAADRPADWIGKKQDGAPWMSRKIIKPKSAESPFG